MNNNLTCSANSCVHNKEGLCSANTILVKGVSASTTSETNCSTYKETSIRNSIASLGNMNYSGQFEQMLNSGNIEMSPDIRCEAMTCKYNTEGFCDSNRVIVSGAHTNVSGGTCCESFCE